MLMSNNKEMIKAIYSKSSGGPEYAYYSSKKSFDDFDQFSDASTTHPVLEKFVALTCLVTQLTF